MPNHVHLVLTPPEKDALRGAMSRVHRQYAGRIHARERRTGHFWQGRFGCVAMDDDHLVAAMAYVVLNPVRAKLVHNAEDWQWSSARAYRRPKSGDGVVDLEAVKPYLKAVKEVIRAGQEDERFNSLRRAETIGRPVGDEGFVKQAEAISGRSLKPAKRGPKPKTPTSN
jgi:putative transposase